MPPNSQASALQERDLLALQSSGISADGAGHLTPLVMAIRQRSLEVSRLLLRWGASPAGALNDGIPLLLHLADALGAGIRPSSGSSSSSAASGTLWREHSTASSGNATGWPCADLPGSTHVGGGVPHAAAAAAAGQGLSEASCRILGKLEDTEQRLQLLHLLLQHQADPLEAARHPVPGQPTFLTGAGGGEAACCRAALQRKLCSSVLAFTVGP